MFKSSILSKTNFTTFFKYDFSKNYIDFYIKMSDPILSLIQNHFSEFGSDLTVPGPNPQHYNIVS
jgi:hypothetical protein